VIKDIGTTNINIDEDLLEKVINSLDDEGYQGAMLYSGSACGIDATG